MDHRFNVDNVIKDPQTKRAYIVTGKTRDGYNVIPLEEKTSKTPQTFSVDKAIADNFTYISGHVVRGGRKCKFTKKSKKNKRRKTHRRDR
jgi:hypothetical protein